MGKIFKGEETKYKVEKIVAYITMGLLIINLVILAFIITLVEIYQFICIPLVYISSFLCLITAIMLDIFGF